MSPRHLGRLSEAFERTGFAVVTGHPVPPEHMRNLRIKARLDAKFTGFLEATRLGDVGRPSRLGWEAIASRFGGHRY